MPKPKYAIAMGACTVKGEMFSMILNVLGIDKLIPMGIYLPDCQPKPEAVIYAITELRKKIIREFLEMK